MILLDSPVQGASFYVGRIDLASKLRKSDRNSIGVDHFQEKSPLTNFQTLDHQIPLLADFTHFEQPFLLQNSKSTYSAPFKTFSYVLQISSKFS